MTDFDERMPDWRYRHVKLVERTIGNERGTGGSLGVDSLKQSLFQPVFPDLSTIRCQRVVGDPRAARCKPCLA